MDRPASRISVPPLVRLLWSPGALAEAAVTCGTVRAILIGGAGWGGLFGFLLGVASLPNDIPSTPDFVLALGWNFVRIGVIVVPLGWVLWAAVLGFAARFSLARRDRRVALALAPVMLSLPVAVWTASVVAACAAEPSLLPSDSGTEVPVLKSTLLFFGVIALVAAH